MYSCTRHHVPYIMLVMCGGFGGLQAPRLSLNYAVIGGFWGVAVGDRWGSWSSGVLFSVSDLDGSVNKSSRRVLRSLKMLLGSCSLL